MKDNLPVGDRDSRRHSPHSVQQLPRQGRVDPFLEQTGPEWSSLRDLGVPIPSTRFHAVHGERRSAESEVFFSNKNADFGLLLETSTNSLTSPRIAQSGNPIEDQGIRFGV